jgi:preprotein translocase subunit SecD
VRADLRADTGRDQAWEDPALTILDSNVTTLIAAVVLFQFGTGPVRGFAVTLTIGILVSLFTAIIVTRIIFDFLLAQQRIRTLSI